MTTVDRRRRIDRTWILLVVVIALAIALGSYLILSALLDREGAPAPRVADVASRIGCSSSSLAGTTELYAAENGSCGVGAKRYAIIVFAGNDQRDRWLAVAQQFGGNYVVGDRFVVTVESVDAARELAPKLDARVA